MRKKSWQKFLAILLSGSVLRILFVLQNRSLWMDEALSVHQASYTLREILVTRVDPVHPPLYYVLLHGWVDWFGDGETAVRMLSALFSIANIALLYFLMRRLQERRSDPMPLFAAALLTLSPINIWYAGEVRMYALLTTLSLMIGIGLVWRTWRGWLLYTTALTIALYTSFVTIPVWILLSAAWFVWFWRREENRADLFRWFLGSLVALALFSPWWPYLRRIFDRLNNITLFDRLLDVVGIGKLPSVVYMLAVPASLLGVTIVFWLIDRYWPEGRYGRWLVACLLLLLLPALLLQVFPRFYTFKRVLVLVWPYYLGLLALLSAAYRYKMAQLVAVGHGRGHAYSVFCTQR
jgi:mannosyltransferase